MPCKKIPYNTNNEAIKALILLTNGELRIGRTYFCGECEKYHLTTSTKKRYVIGLVNKIKGIEANNVLLKNKIAELERNHKLTIEISHNKYQELLSKYQNLLAKNTSLSEQELIDKLNNLQIKYKEKNNSLVKRNTALLKTNSELIAKLSIYRDNDKLQSQ
jgi:hypothetical protein